MAFKELNDKQQEAVLATEGPLLILAGAGSGKTSTMTHSIAHLVEEGVDPYNILAVTFTNKAANEMRTRVEDLIGDIQGMWIMTFHAMCLRILHVFAEEAGLPVAHKPDSQEICFVTDGHYADFVGQYAAQREEKDLFSVPGPGPFVDESGNVLGTHKGIIHYTIGQRKGLGIALGHPVYVKEIRASSNEVVLSDEPALFSDTVLVRDVNFLSIPGMAPGEEIRARAKVRYHHQASPALIMMREDGSVRLLFDSPVRAAAPGQSAVFYDDSDCVIGGGIIM